jgi:hypothetical protein
MRNRNAQLSLLPASAGFLLSLLFDSEDGSDMFLRNVGLSPDYTALQPIAVRTLNPLCSAVVYRTYGLTFETNCVVFIPTHTDENKINFETSFSSQQEKASIPKRKPEVVWVVSHICYLQGV